MMRTLVQSLFLRGGFAVALMLLTWTCRDSAWAQSWTASAAVAAAPLDVVVDLDGTLIFNAAGPASEAFPAEGGWYRWGADSRPFLEQLRRIPGVRLSFFSGGSRGRNDEVLKRMKFSDGLSAFDIAYRNLNADDMVQVSQDPTERYSFRYKKDLRKVNPDLRRVIIVDDIHNFVLPGQEQNTIWLGKRGNRDHPLMSALNLIKAAELSSRSSPVAFLHFLHAGFCSQIFSE